MKKTFFAYAVAAALFAFALYAESSKKGIVAYYSWSGNTKAVAQEIGRQTGYTLYEIKPKEAYSRSYPECLKRARKELSAGESVPLEAEIPDLSGYDSIFIGSPVWCGELSVPVSSFMKAANLENIKVFPFVTHGGGGPGKSLGQAKELSKKATAGKALNLRGGADCAAPIARWLDEIGFAKE